MKLFYSPGACSLAPHILLREAGLTADLVRVDLATKKTEQGEDFRSINPKGYVPALVLDAGGVLTETAVILQYLADLAPDKKLIPAAGDMERYRCLEWLNFISTELHKSLGALFNPNTPQTWREIVLQMLSRRLDFIAKQLADQPYLMGSSFMAADAYLFTLLSWTAQLNIDLSNWPVLKEYLARVAARPAVRQTLTEEGLLKG